MEHLVLTNGVELGKEFIDKILQKDNLKSSSSLESYLFS